MTTSKLAIIFWQHCREGMFSAMCRGAHMVKRRGDNARGSFEVKEVPERLRERHLPGGCRFP